MTQVVRPYRGVSAETRRSQRRLQLVDGCLDVIGEVGVQATTVDAVCSAARLTKRYFYESFADRDEILVAALDQLFVDLDLQMRSAVARRTSARTRARAAVELLLATLTSDPRSARLYVEAPGHPLLRERRDQAISAFTVLIAAEVFDFGGRRRGAGSQELAARLVVSGTTDLITSWLSGAITADRETLVATIVAVGLAASGR